MVEFVVHKVRFTILIIVIPSARNPQRPLTVIICLSEEAILGSVDGRES